MTEPIIKPCWYEEPCEGGHVFMGTTGNASDRLPGGIPCQCGKTRLKYRVIAEAEEITI